VADDYVAGDREKPRRESFVVAQGIGLQESSLEDIRHEVLGQVHVVDAAVDVGENAWEVQAILLGELIDAAHWVDSVLLRWRAIKAKGGHRLGVRPCFNLRGKATTGQAWVSRA
jgi:hypothetical protein